MSAQRRWISFLPWPRPSSVPIDRAIELAKLEADMACESCSISGGYEPGGGGGQAREVEKDYAELKRLRDLKRDGETSVRI